jgi:hypothetical protein
MRWHSILLSLAGLCALLNGQVAHSSEELSTALQSGHVYGFGKVMYVADDKKGGRLNQSTPGFGGKIGGETGDYYGFSLKGAWYTTRDFGLRSANPKETDAYMFDVDKTPYSLLGEAQLNFVAGRTTLTFGRQEIHSPLLSSYDYRIIPNLYEAYTLTNRDLAATAFTLSYVGKMAGLDGLPIFSAFRSMSQQAYTSLMVTADGTVDARNGDTMNLAKVVGNKGVWMAGLVYEKEHALQIWNTYGSDTLNTLYVEGKFKKNLSGEWSTVLDGQAYRVAEVGQFKEYLAQRGLNARYGLYGVKGTLAHKPSGLSAMLAYNHFTGDHKTVTAYGNWGGYPEFVSMPYLYAENDGVSAIARSRLSKVSVLLDLGAYGLQGHSLLFGHARIDIDETIQANSDILVNSLLYRAKLSPKLSARVLLEARNSGHSRYNNEFVAASLRYDF